VILCLQQCKAQGTCIGTVVLAHGMFSNHRTCRGLAGYLTTLNFDCWLVDFQGHGFSDNPDQAPDFERMCLEDTESIFIHIKNKSKTRIWWIGHSGGGLAIYMYLARNTQQQKYLAGLVTLASQATDAAIHFRSRLALTTIRMLLRISKRVPGKILGLGPENESTPVLDQWLRWNISKCWSGTDGFDYLTHLANIRIPALTLAGTADKFIAPVSGCKLLHECLGSRDKTFLLCGKQGGFLEDYTHDRLISSRNASTDVWPRIGKWLLSQCN